LLFPRSDDPVVTRFGKLSLVLAVAAFVVPGLHEAIGTLLGAYPLPQAPADTFSLPAERAFVEHVWLVYAVVLLLAFLLALAWPRLRWPRRARQGAVESDEAN
jgi:hypothetical protein